MNEKNLLILIIENALGELAENLTILGKEEWLNPHYNLKEHFQEDTKLGKKVGSRKLKREYAAAVIKIKNNNKLAK